MKLLSVAAVTTLNRNLLLAKLPPLAAVPSISDIHLICDLPGPPIPKVTYHATGSRADPFDSDHGATRKHALRRLVPAPAARLFFLLWVSIRYRCPIVMAYNLIPHGMTAWVVARLLRRQLYLHLIGSFVEIDIDPATSDTRLIKRLRGPSPLFTRVMRRLVRSADLLFVPGRVTAERLVSEVGIDRARIVVLHSAVDPQRFVPQPDRPQDYDVITTAAFTRRKRYDRFFAVVRCVADKRPGLRVAVLGAGPDKADILRMVEEQHLGGIVTLLGYHEHTEEYYPRARLFLLASEAEGLSLASMEAMSCGLPAIVSNVGDMADVVITGETGVLVQPVNDIPQYCDAIERLLNDEARRARLGAAARRLIGEEHSPLAATQLWTAVLKDVRT